jgi:hypothetical protein
MPRHAGGSEPRLEGGAWPGMLNQEPGFAESFVAYLLSRNSVVLHD